jgi:hypothetical protein
MSMSTWVVNNAVQHAGGHVGDALVQGAWMHVYGRPTQSSFQTKFVQIDEHRSKLVIVSKGSMLP